MAYKILTDTCTNCGTCEADCPTEAISEKDGKRWIDADTCADCGTCEANCPAQAIVQE
jgi:ferredoxin